MRRQRTCSISGCDRAHMARGWCGKHYLRWYYTKGETLEPFVRPLADQSCTVQGCESSRRAQGLCNKHYLRLWATGSIELAERPTAQELFWRKVEKTQTCSIWRGARINTGYGVLTYQGRTVLAHRLIYEWAHGPIAPGLTVDHLCYEPACVRLDHLEAVTQAENNRRARQRRACIST